LVAQLVDTNALPARVWTEVLEWKQMGAEVALADGALLGAREGVADGFDVVGALLGDWEGFAVGGVGARDGDWEGFAVGGVGAREGALVGRSVGTGVVGAAVPTGWTKPPDSSP
jgi:hypothetical protein